MNNASLLSAADAALANLADDPKTAMSQYRIAKRALAYQCTASNIEEANAHLLDLARFNLDVWESGVLIATPESQNESIIVALAAGSFALVRDLAAIVPPIGESHPFDLRLNAALRRRLGAEVTDSSRYTPTVVEESLFSAFERPRISVTDVSSYWIATRNTRYSRTPFEKYDFFSAALVQLKKG